MTTIVFATSNATEAAQRLREANEFITDDQLGRLVALVEAGAIRVADGRMHTPGDVYIQTEATPEQVAEVQAIGAEIITATRAGLEARR